MSAQLIAALHAYLARSPASILLVQIDDLMRRGGAGQPARHRVRAPQLAAPAVDARRPAAGSAGLPGVAPGTGGPLYDRLSAVGRRRPPPVEGLPAAAVLSNSWMTNLLRRTIAEWSEKFTRRDREMPAV